MPPSGHHGADRSILGLQDQDVGVPLVPIWTRSLPTVETALAARADRKLLPCQAPANVTRKPPITEAALAFRMCWSTRSGSRGAAAVQTATTTAVIFDGLMRASPPSGRCERSRSPSPLRQGP